MIKPRDKGELHSYIEEKFKKNKYLRIKTEESEEEIIITLKKR